MSLTIELPASVEERLRERAVEAQCTMEEVASTLLAQLVEDERASTIEGIRRGLADFEAGRFRPFEEFAVEQRARYNLPPV